MSSRHPSPPSRIGSLDVARGAAVISMLVAHLAPGAPLGHLTMLSEWLTAALFALLIGAGAQAARRRSLPAAMTVAIIRGLVLVVVGLLLERSPGQIDVVLVELGALTVVAPLLVRIPSGVLAVGALVMTLLCRPLLDAAAPHLVSLHGEGHPHVARLLEVLVAGQHYRLTSLIVHAALGVLVVRHLVPGGRWRPLRWGAVASVVAVGLLALHLVGVVTATPYSGTVAEVGVAAGLAVAVASVSLVIAHASVPAWAEPLRAAGTMAMSLYVAQVVGLSLWLGTQPPGTTDDSWALLGLCVVLTLVVPLVWQGLTPWRGPLEAVTDLLVRLVRQTRSPQPSGSSSP